MPNGSYNAYSTVGSAFNSLNVTLKETFRLADSPGKSANVHEDFF